MRDRLPIGDITVDIYATTLTQDNKFHDFWESMDDDGHNKPEYIKGYVEWMHKQMLTGMQPEDRMWEILKGADLDKYLI